MKFTLLLLAMLISVSVFSQNITGAWHGKLALPGIELAIVFHIEENGTMLNATMDSPNQKTFGIPVNKVSFEHNELEIVASNLGISYKGQLVDTTNILGEFRQGGQKFPLNLTKGNIVVEKPNRPQEPKKPFDYNAEEIVFKNEKDNIELAGTFTFPKSGHNFPAVVLISGSGAQNRNEELAKHKPFLVLSDYLTSHGIAVLRYDDRGTAKSNGDFANSTTHDFANDAEAALNYLKTRKELNINNIGLVGHSEGGVIASMIASRNEHVNFIVLMASSALRGDKLLLLQKKNIETQMGINAFVIESNQEAFEGAYEIILSSNSETNLQSSLSNYFASKYGEALPEKQLEALVAQLTNPWLVEFVKIDPALYLEKVSCKVLALNGAKDLQVASKENLGIIQSALEKTGNNDYSVKEFTGLNHLFQECDTGLPSEYGEIEQTISPKVLEEISKWITNIRNE